MTSGLKGIGGNGAADATDLLIDEELKDLLMKKGSPLIPFELLSDIGDHLMIYIRGSAKRLAGRLQEEESRQI